MRYLDPPDIREKWSKIEPYLIHNGLDITLRKDAPDYIKKLNAEVMAFWKKRDELEMELMGAPQ